jgi:hypothetical protein
MSLFSAYFFASRCINPKERGGRGLPAKVVQDLLGHSSITTLTGIYFRAAMTAPNWRKHRVCCWSEVRLKGASCSRHGAFGDIEGALARK